LAGRSCSAPVWHCRRSRREAAPARRIIRAGRSTRSSRSPAAAPATSSVGSCSTAWRSRSANRSSWKTSPAVAAHATPDGYTILGSGSGPVAANVTLYKQLDYDPQKDFETISPFAGFTIVVVASNKLPVNNLQELIVYAKAHPGELNYGSVGIGSSQHLAGEYFSQLTGAKLTHVPYKNIGQYVPDLMAGQVPLGFQWLPNVAAALQAKGAHALAVAGTNRLEALPDVPTTKEAGLPEYIVSGWFALLVPKGTPDAIVKKLNSEVGAALKDPEVHSRFQQQGAEPIYLSLEQSKAFMADEIAKYRDIITKANIPQID
jgi:tripartite-type tricarboxylate transporter receptor subunit TctC